MLRLIVLGPLELGVVGGRSRLVSRSGSRVAIAALGGIGVSSDALVLDIGDEAILVISGVSNNLDATVGEVDSEAACNITIGILVLSLVEAGARVGVLNTVLVLIGLGWELLLLVGRGMRLVGGGSIGRGMAGTGGSGGNSHEGTESDKALQ